MTILVCGGGSGGHITPLLAVAHELKVLLPDCRVVCVSEHGGKFRHLIESEDSFDERYWISAGKYRRYHGQSKISKLFDVKTIILNIRDFFRFLRGRIQSGRIMKQVKPDVVFVKGGFVGVPIGLAAARRKIPIITHDSDTIPGLANRIVSRWAQIHATGMPAELYTYPQSQVRFTGVPVSKQYKLVNTEIKLEFRKKLGIPDDAFMVLITGGSQGAQSMNDAIASQYDELLKLSSNLLIVHQVGRKNIRDGLPRRVKQYEFIDNMYIYSGAADVILCRPGASTMTELGIQAKPTILFPGIHLAGGHQVKNATYFSSNDAALVVDESKPLEVLDSVRTMFEDSKKRKILAENLHQLIKYDAAKEIARLLINVGDNKK